jgi:hypothetical protein
LDDLLKLSLKERARIAEALIRSLETDNPPPGPSEEEIKQRLRKLRENPDQRTISWAEVCDAVGWEK